jgi:XTP/dITP diphosphohydrolase
LSGEPAIADDSGLLVAALGGAPGILSARFAGEGAGDRANCGKLLAALHDVPEGRRGAQFVCVMVALLAADDPAPRICCGRWSGQVALAPRGSNGFGYDPLFIDPEHGMTAAELPADVKNRISHRARAWTALCAALAEAPREPG